MARIRTFLAIDLGRGIRDRCVALQETLARTGAQLKWVEPENLHVTLIFLGEVDEREIPAITRAVRKVCAGHEPFALSVEGTGCFPNPERPRVVWAGIGSGQDELVALHGDLESPLLELGCYRREDRRYTPHVTLGRGKDDGDGALLAPVLGKQANWRAGETQIREILLMRSELTPQGPVYSVLDRAALGGESDSVAEE